MSVAADAVAQQLGGATQALSVLGTVLLFHGRKTITHLTTKKLFNRTFYSTLNRTILCCFTFTFLNSLSLW
jgi:hypothetical protein